MYCSEEISRKIKVLSFCAMVTVVTIHVDFPSLHVGLSPVTCWVSNILSILKYWAVPFFFMVSGFFFSRFVEGESCAYRKLLERKWVGLIVPYLLWGAIYGLLAFLPLSALVNRSKGVALSTGTALDPLNPLSVLDKSFGLFNAAPANGALWYVRMLIILFLLAPMWAFVQKRIPVLLLLAGLSVAVWFGVVGDHHDCLLAVGSVTVYLKWGAFGYFALGMWVAVWHRETVRFPWFLSLGLIALSVALACKGIPRHMVAPLLVMGMWGLYDVIPRLLPVRLPWVIGLSFWVYCMHHPLAGYVGAINRMMLGKGELSYCVQIVLNPLLVICFAIGWAYFVRRLFPRLFEILNGGRG